MNSAFLEETDLEVIPYMLKNMIKQSKRMGAGKPFHGRRSCEDRSECLIHGGKR